MLTIGHSSVINRRFSPENFQMFVYRPEGGYDRLTILLHGVGRTDLRPWGVQAVREFAERNRSLAISPYLKNTGAFAGSSGYAWGGVSGNAPGDWTFRAADAALDRLAEIDPTLSMPVTIFGHSAGGQHANRMAALQWPGRVTRIVAANSGSYIWPTRDVNYPNGFGDLDTEFSDDNAIRRFLQQPLTIYAGTADTDPNDNLPSAPGQGDGRLERAQNFYAAGLAAATDLGVTLAWRYREAAGVAHASSGMLAAPEADEAIFG